MKKCLLIPLLLFSCSPQYFLISSNFQHWVGGRPETGSGTNYNFKIVAPENDKAFKIESIKSHKKILGFRINPPKFSKGDTLIISAYKTKTVWESDTLCKIKYKINNTSFTIMPKEMEELEKLLYP